MYTADRKNQKISSPLLFSCIKKKTNFIQTHKKKTFAKRQLIKIGIIQ